MVMLIVCNRVNTLFMDLYCTLYLINMLCKVSFYSINIVSCTMYLLLCSLR